MSWLPPGAEHIITRQWYLDLEADPEVVIQVGAERMRGRAGPITGEERRRLWRQMAEIWPDYDQERTQRRIPVVVVHPCPGEHSYPTLTSRHAWRRRFRPRPGFMGRRRG